MNCVTVEVDELGKAAGAIGCLNEMAYDREALKSKKKTPFSATVRQKGRSWKLLVIITVEPC